METRLRRQAAVFDRPRPPLSVFVIDEAALRRGRPDIMADQLDHLMALAERPAVMIHVLPLTAGFHPGQAGPFVIASTPDGGNCVEVADNLPGVVLVRDTKDRDGGTLTFEPAAWSGFVGLAKKISPVG